MKFKIFIVAILLISCVNDVKEKVKNNQDISLDIKEEYYKNGKIKVRSKIEDGIEHGAYYKFHENEVVESFGIKIKGKMNGVWKFYNSLGYITSAKHYHNDSLIYDLDVNDFDYVKRKLENRIEIEIPKRWKIIEEIESNSILLVIRKECEKKISFCPNLTITYESSIPDNEIENYLKKNNEILNSSFNNYRVIKDRKYIYEGITYFEKVYTGSSKNINLGGITTWVFDKKKIYIITGLALNEKGNSFLKNEGLFKDITKSIKMN